MASLSPGARVGPFEIIASLRGGGMATLWLARRVGPAGFSRPVAIKVIHEHLADDRTFVEMFLDEARLAAKIVHPNVVRVEELGKHDRTYYLAMEWIRGAALSSLTKGLREQQRGLTPAVASAIAMQVADGLHAAHEAKDDHGVALDVIHRDVSPQNILVSVTGHVKLIDFGVAKARGRRQQSEAGELRGKLRYMAPEQAWGRSIDRRADVYALGVVLWELLTREPLFRGDSEIELLEAVRNPRIIPPNERDESVSEALSEVVMTALAADPAARYQTAQALRRALGNACPEATRIEPDALAALLASVARKELEEQSRMLSALTEEELSLPSVERSEVVLTQLTTPTPELPTVAATTPATQAQRAQPTAATGPANVERGSAPTVAVSAIALLALGMVGATLWKKLRSGATTVVGSAAGARPACEAARVYELGDAGSRSVSLDTRERPTGIFPIGIIHRQGVTKAPEVLLQVRVDGDGPRAIELSTVNTGTDVRFDTTIGVYRGACDESMVRRAPDFAFDDDGAAREFRARGSFVARGGELLTIVVTGYGGSVAGRVDRGLVQLDIASRDEHRPALTNASVLVAGHSMLVSIEGADEDRDLAGAQVQLLDQSAAPLQRADRDGASLFVFDRSVEGLPEIRERLLVELPATVELARARSAAVRLRDRPGDASEALVVPVVQGAIVGAGARCDSTHVCATELVCNARGVCQATGDRLAACELAQTLAWTFDPDGVGRARSRGIIVAGNGSFTGTCVRDATRGREEIVRVRVPPGRWRLVAHTDAPLAAGASTMEPDTIVYVRRRCTDMTESSAPLSACNDDIVPGSNQRSRVEQTISEPGDYFVFVEVWGGSLNDARGEPYEVMLELHPAGRDE